MPYINSIGTANPSNKINQRYAAEWLNWALDYNARLSDINISLHEHTAIATRYSVLTDFADHEQASFYQKSRMSKGGPSTEERLLCYRTHAAPLAARACSSALESSYTDPGSITHLIVISCTGQYAPGLDIDLVKALGLSTKVARQQILFMGCYAAINGIRAASDILLGQPEAVVLVVCVELCTLHMQASSSKDDLMSNALFSDGAAALVCTNSRTSTSFKIISTLSDIADDRGDAMAWSIGNTGFRMKLTGQVPKLISKALPPFHERIKDALDGGLIQHWAMHPGGVRILDEAEHVLNLTTTSLQASRSTLYKYGNMSSPTVLFVLKELQEQAKLAEDEPLAVIAFGPGLTLESALLSYHA